MTHIRRFLTWLGTKEEDKEIKSALRDCMRFMVFLLIAGSVIYSGAESFDLGEGRTTLLMALMGYGGAKFTH